MEVDAVAVFPHDDDTVGGASPHASPLVECEGAHLLVFVVRVVAYGVVAVDDHLPSLSVFREDVDTASVGGNPDVALLVFHGAIDVFVVEPHGVVSYRAVALVLVAVGRRRHAYQSCSLGADPVVALAVAVDAIDASEVARSAHVVDIMVVESVCNFQASLFVAHDGYFALCVVIQCSGLVDALVASGLEEREVAYGLFQYLEFVESLSACSLPYHSLLQGEKRGEGVRQFPGVEWVVVEILYLVGLAVVVAEASVVHVHPDASAYLCHHGCVLVVFWHGDHLLVVFYQSCRGVESRDALLVGGKPQVSVRVFVYGAQRHTGVEQYVWVFAVGTFHHLSRLCSGIDVVSVREHAGDALVFHYAHVVYLFVAGVELVYAFVGAHPHVVLISLDDRGDIIFFGRDESFRYAVAGAVHAVDAHAVHDDEDVAVVCGCELVRRAQLFVSRHVFEGVDDAVGGALQHEDAVVVHPHPYVLHTVNLHVEDAVVE